MTNNVEFSTDIQNKILMHLDGWQIEAVEDDINEEEEISVSTDINPFVTEEEAAGKPNKLITPAECQLFYEEALSLAYSHTNRLNIDDLTSIEANIFIGAVCKWAASNLWNKYNIRVNNEDMEDTYVQSYGGLLYKSALNTLKQFINQRITGLTGYSDDDQDDIWVV